MANYTTQDETQTSDLVSLLDLDESKDIGERIEKISELIDEREKIKSETVKGIDDLILDCHNRILEIEQDPYANKIRDKTAFEKAVLDLEKLKLQEMRNVFMDRTRLKENLIDCMIDYKQEQRMNDFQRMVFPGYTPMNPNGY